MTYLNTFEMCIVILARTNFICESSITYGINLVDTFDKLPASQ
jgi:hypothetical protein